MSEDIRRVVLVTGASSGFGRLTVETLARRGHQVFAALRDVPGRNAKAAAELAALASADKLDLHVVELDVTDQDSADHAIDSVTSAAGRLDAVVNNAGGIFPGPVEAFAAEEAQRQFDVNVFGALRVARAALPRLREQGHGVLIQVGSISSRVTIPYSGLYAASKAALGSLTEAWHHELAPFGVEAVIVDAAPYPTNIGANAVLPADSARFGAYGEGFGRFVAELTERQTQTPGDPTAVSDAIVALVETPDGERPLRTVVAPAAQLDAVQALNAQAGETAQAVSADMGVSAFLAGHPTS
ncbi:SDR family oxidoreductase [Paractinoplanes hotanensis]|uniref:SDR family oxidoreductase n=1 Tax=Paractinoplanes hotanensis TaxID=2906497 RepID=A0ABT0Y0E9_9ACTN|nr:SDR family oxidoreductase [Actinoplanes hotanensis]MCM4079513.1 SDR family oxidoreductase [Actinoplanes hotanensis]